MKKLEIWLLVCASFLMAAAVAILSLGFGRLRFDCEICQREIAILNILSHMRWHLKRGEWEH